MLIQMVTIDTEINAQFVSVNQPTELPPKFVMTLFKNPIEGWKITDQNKAADATDIPIVEEKIVEKNFELLPCFS